MEQKINLYKILENAPSGMELYTPLSAEKFVISSATEKCIRGTLNNECYEFNTDGTFIEGGECMIWPSRTNMCWHTWQKTLVRKGDFIYHPDGRMAIVSHTNRNSFIPFICKTEKGKVSKRVESLSNFGYMSESQKEEFIEWVKENGYSYDIKNQKLIEKFEPGDLIVCAGDYFIHERSYGIYHSRGQVYCSIMNEEMNPVPGNFNTDNAHRACDEEREYFENYLRDNGYIWNSELMIIEKARPRENASDDDSSAKKPELFVEKADVDQPVVVTIKNVSPEQLKILEKFVKIWRGEYTDILPDKLKAEIDSWKEVAEKFIIDFIKRK